MIAGGKKGTEGLAQLRLGRGGQRICPCVGVKVVAGEADAEIQVGGIGRGFSGQQGFQGVGGLVAERLGSGEAGCWLAKGLVEGILEQQVAHRFRGHELEDLPCALRFCRQAHQGLGHPVVKDQGQMRRPVALHPQG